MTDAAVLAWRQYRLERHLFWRNPSAAFFNFLLPLLFLALLRRDLPQQPPRARRHRARHRRDGVMSTTFTALAYNLTFLREQGVLKRIRGTPMPSGVLPRAGSRGNAVTNAALQIVIITVAGQGLLRHRVAARTGSSSSCSSSPGSSASRRWGWRSRT